MPAVTNSHPSIQYDGTNGSHIANTWATNIDFVSDNGTTFVYEDRDNAQHSMAVGDWMVDFGDGYPFTGSPAFYAQTWTEIPTGLKLSSGHALTPSIDGSGGTANVAVGLDSAMSGTGYQATAALAGTPELLADLEITDVTITDSDTVTVEVTNNDPSALAGATVIVEAGELT